MICKQISKHVRTKIEDFEIITKLAVPNRMHQMHYSEKQTMYGLSKTFYFYNNSTNDQIKITCNLKNDFYNSSNITLNLLKTSLNSKGLNFNNVNENLFEGPCEEANQIF